MKRLWLAFLALALLLGAAQGEGEMQTTELWQVTAEDGCTLTGKLDLPAGEVRHLAVSYTHLSTFVAQVIRGMMI